MIQEKLIAMIAEQFGVEPETVTLETSFEGDLGADSIDLVELSMALEEEFSVDEMDEDDVATISTVGDLLKYVQAKLDDM
ncbi:MAG: acyl carrier protein [Oscillospiraceae bacterium]